MSAATSDPARPGAGATSRRSPAVALARPRVGAAGVGVGLLLLAGLVLRVVTTSKLWLDEALTVNIARLPLSELPRALHHDGAPPLYYVLLHLWMLVFGASDVAVRGLSGAASAATLPLVWLAGERLGGRRAAWAATLLLATNPFAVRHATETRMYALVVLEVAAGLLLVLRYREAPSTRRLVPVGLLAAALLYTHYWALYLLATAVLLFATKARRARSPRGPDAQLVTAIVVGSLLWLPWVPTFLFQAVHTGTPWAPASGVSSLVIVVTEFAGGSTNSAKALGLFLTAAVLLGLFGGAIDGQRVELDLRGRPGARPLFALFIGCMGLALLASVATGSAFAARYYSIGLVPFLLVAGLGLATFVDRRVFTGVVSALCGLGVAASVPMVTLQRSQAGEVAGYLATAGRAGDVVAFCPDQLGPATLRLLGDRFQSVGFPRASVPRLIDWVDYDDVNRAASPAVFAQLLVDRAGADHDIWLVSSDAYRTASTSCRQVQAVLSAIRPAGREVLPQRVRYFEEASLSRFPPATAT